MKRGMVGLLILTIVLATVFRGGSEIEQQAFAVSIAVDREPNGKLLVSLQVPVIKQSGGGAQSATEDGAGNESSGYRVIDAVANTLMEASEILDAAIPRELSYAQVVQVLVAEDLATGSDFIDLLSDVAQMKNMHPSAVLTICRGKAQDFLKNQKPTFGIRLSIDIATHVELAQNMGIIPITSLGEVMRFGRGAWRDMIVPYGAITSDILLPIRDEEGRPLDKQAGDLPLLEADEVTYFGAALLKNGRMVGSLTGMEMQFLSFLLGTVKEFAFDAGNVHYQIHQTKPASIQAVQGSDGWIFRIKGRIMAKALHFEALDEEKLRDAFSQEILSLLRKLQTLGVDPLGLEGLAVRNVRTMAEWSHDQWLHEYERATIEASVHVTVGDVR